MSLLPYILGELRDLSGDVFEAPAPRHHFHPYRRWVDLDTSFEDVDDVLRPRSSLLRLLSDDASRLLVTRPRKHRPAAAPAMHKKAGVVKKCDDNNALAIDVDVQQFRPEELSVQVLKDQGVVVIEGHHEERHDRPDEHGFVQHHFSRRFKLPGDVDPDTITSRLSAEGVLQVTAPRKEALPAPKEANVRNIPIAHAEKPALNQSSDKEAEKQPEKDKEETQVHTVN